MCLIQEHVSPLLHPLPHQPISSASITDHYDPKQGENIALVPEDGTLAAYTYIVMVRTQLRVSPSRGSYPEQDTSKGTKLDRDRPTVIEQLAPATCTP